MKKWMQLLILVASVTSTGTLLANGTGSSSYGDEERGEEHSDEKYRRSNVERASGILPQVSNAKWKAECGGSCHMLYHPALLPERSWVKMMAGLDKHFGENAELDAATRDEITRFLSANSSDKMNDRRSRRINQSITPGEEPLRFTETEYFDARHDDISAATYKRKSIGSPSNCVACHPKAEQGDYSENKVKIPR